MPHPHVDIQTLSNTPTERSQDRIGKRYGSLLIERYLGHKWYKPYYQARCDCGDIKIVSGKSLYSKRSLACQRCLSRSKSAHHSWKGIGEIPGTLWNSYVRGAKERGLAFELTLGQGWDLFLKQGGKCALSGLDISFATKNSKACDTTASLDRIDSSKGYLFDNVQWVHKSLNYVKSNIANEVFVLMCNLVAKNCPVTVNEQLFHDNHEHLMRNTFRKRRGEHSAASKAYELEREDGKRETIIGLLEFARTREMTTQSILRTLKTHRFYKGVKLVRILDRPNQQKHDTPLTT